MKIFAGVLSLLFGVLFLASGMAVEAQGGTTVVPCAEEAWKCGLKSAGSAGLPASPIYNIIGTTLSWLLAILGFISIAAFVISGLLYLTSAGNDSQIEQAKEAMKYSIIGVIVALVGYVAVTAIDTWLRAETFF